MEGFTAHQASKFTGCTSRQLRYWDQIGLVEPSVQGTGGRPGVPRLYSFRDLVALRVVKSLLDGGMSLQRVRRAWEFLNRKAGLDRHLSDVKLVTDGQSVFKTATATARSSTRCARGRWRSSWRSTTSRPASGRT